MGGGQGGKAGEEFVIRRALEDEMEEDDDDDDHVIIQARGPMDEGFEEEVLDEAFAHDGSLAMMAESSAAETKVEMRKGLKRSEEKNAVKHREMAGSCFPGVNNVGVR